jgi:hypothetical protein
VSYPPKMENRLKMLFRLSSNVRYYGRTFGVVLHNGSRVAGGTFD